MPKLAEQGSGRFREARQRPRRQAGAERLLGGRPEFALELRLALVPHVQELLRRGRPDEARVDQSGKPHARDVARVAVDALDVPAGSNLSSIWLFSYYVRGLVESHVFGGCFFSSLVFFLFSRFLVLSVHNFICPFRMKSIFSSQIAFSVVHSSGQAALIFSEFVSNASAR